MPQAMTIPAATSAVEKEWEKLEKIPAWDLTKVRNKSDVITEARKGGRKVLFASLMDICHLKNSELEPKFQNMRRSPRAPRCCERRFWILRCVHSAGIVRFTDGCTSSGRLLPDFPDAQDKQTMQDQVTLRSKGKTLHTCLNFRSRSVPDLWVRLPRHTLPKSWHNIRDPVAPLERNLHGQPLACFLWKRPFEKGS